MNIQEFQNEIKNCKECSKYSDLNKITFKKPKNFFIKPEINTIILGHSPKVRTSEEAEYVLKMDKENQPLYKYINKKILEPLNINVDNIYCTNLLKCMTNEMPEDIKDKKNFISLSIHNCKELFEKEVALINPKVIISLSKTVLTFICKYYYFMNLSISESFGRLFEITIDGKIYKYIPVVHIQKNKKGKEKYYAEQINRLKDHQNIFNE